MPTCPKCGNPRIDRFCAQCGAAATIIHDKRVPPLPALPAVPPPPPLPRIPPRRQNALGGVLIFFLLLFLVAVAMMAFFGVHRSSPPTFTSDSTNTRSYPVDSTLANFLRQFDMDVSVRIADLQASMHSLSIGQNLDDRVAQLKRQLDDAASLRERLAAALRLARLENRWPVEVAGVRFYRPSQLQEAVDSANNYLRRGAAGEEELARVSDQNRRVKTDADRKMAEIQRIRADVHLVSIGQLQTDMPTLREKHARMIELASELSNTLRNRADVNWKKTNIAPFRYSE